MGQRSVKATAGDLELKCAGVVALADLKECMWLCGLEGETRCRDHGL